MDPTAALSIVRLDGIHTPAPFFSPTFKHTYTSHDHTPFDDSVIIPRLKDADICITTRVPITAATLAVCPKLKLIAVLAIGVDMIDLVACREKGVIVVRQFSYPLVLVQAVRVHEIFWRVFVKDIFQNLPLY